MVIFVCGLVSIAATILIAILIAGLRKDRDGEWHAHTEFRMRRWVENGWEYRPMTSMEYEDSMVDCYSPK
jgi:uncharacterized membrane protein